MKLSLAALLFALSAIVDVHGGQTFNSNPQCHKARRECELCDFAEKCQQGNNRRLGTILPNPSRWCHRLYDECGLCEYLHNGDDGCEWPKHRRLGFILPNPSKWCHKVIDDCELCDYIENDCPEEED